MTLYNADFLICVKSDDLMYIYMLITKMFHHPPFSLETYIYDVGEIRKCVATHEDMLEEWHACSYGLTVTAPGQEIVVSCTDWSNILHVISNRLSY